MNTKRRTNEKEEKRKEEPFPMSNSDQYRYVLCIKSCLSFQLGDAAPVHLASSLKSQNLVNILG